jgi:hypothetical protein
LEVNGQLHVPGALLPEKELLVPIGNAGWIPDSVWRKLKSSNYWESNPSPYSVAVPIDLSRLYRFPRYVSLRGSCQMRFEVITAAF